MKRSTLVIVILLVLAGFTALFLLKPRRPSSVVSQAQTNSAPVPAVASAVAGPSQAPAPAVSVPAAVTGAGAAVKEARQERGLVAAALLAGLKPLATRETPGIEPGTVRRERLVRTTFKYPLLRVVETVRADGTVARRDAMVADHVMVRVNEGVGIEQLRVLAAQIGGEVHGQMSAIAPRYYLVNFPQATLDTVPTAVAHLKAASNIVHLAAADDLVQATATTPNDTDFGSLWGMHNTGQAVNSVVGTAGADIHAVEAWDLERGSSNIVVGVVDTGINYTHPDLAANAWTNPGEIPGNGVDDDGNGFIDDVHGVDFYNNDSDPMDDHGHGSHCSGTIGAVGNNGTGVVGVCWTVRMAGLKHIGANGSGANSDAVKGVYYAIRMGFNVTSHSYSSSVFNPAMVEAIAEAAQANQMVVAASGNANSDTDAAPEYPAAYTNANIISVAATDNKDALWSSSNYGQTNVDLAAPGVSIWSTLLGSSYGFYSGTSMAGPHVAGAAALAFSRNPTAGFATIKSNILASVDALPALTGKCVSGGRLNVYKLILSMGMGVYSSTPARDVVLGSAPTSFVVRFTDNYASNTVQAADFTVNGTPATTVVYNTTNTVTFQFSSSPVTQQGPQTMAIAAGSLNRVSDNGGIAAWMAVFYYDLAPLTVLSTVPTNGATVALPLTNLTVRFSEPVATNSVDAGDLVIYPGTVIGFRMVAADTVAFSISNVVDETPVNFGIAVRGITDTNGNPNATGYGGTLYPDFVVTPYSGTFSDQLPAGCLAQAGTVAAGQISTASDTDSFTFALNAGQTFTAAVETSNTLQARVELRDGANTLLASANAGGAGQPAVLPAVAVSAAGNYTLTVSGQGGTMGGYSVHPILNAAVEAEQYGGAANNSLGAAQNLDAAFASLAGNATRAAVLGSLAGAGGNDWFGFTSAAGSRVTLVVVGYNGGDAGVELYNPAGTLLASGGGTNDTVDQVIDNVLVAGSGMHYARVTGDATNYTLVVLQNAAFDLEANDSFAAAQNVNGRTTILGAMNPPTALYGVDWRPADENYNRTNVILKLDPTTCKIRRSFDAPMTFGSLPPDNLNLAYDGTNLWYNDGMDTLLYKLNPATGAVLNSYWLNPSAIYDSLGYYRGELFLEDLNEQIVEVYSASNLTFQRNLPVDMVNADQYSGLSGDDAHGCFYIATATAFLFYQIDPTNGDILAELPNVGRNHTTDLTVLGDELFVAHADRNITNSFINIHDRLTGKLKSTIPVRGSLGLGGIACDGTGTSDDWYQVTLTGGTNYTLTTQTPGANNVLDPAIELYNGAGTLVASDNNSAGDSRNAQLTYTVATGGTYRVRVRSVSGLGAFVLTLVQGSGAVVDPFAQWQQQYFGCTSCPQALAGADTDGDGMSNTNEFIWGTNPTNKLSVLRIVSATQQGNDINVAWTTAGGRTNVLQAATQLGGSNLFSDIPGANFKIPGSGDATTNYVDVGAATNTAVKFYRVRLAP